jgi:hypothetical protein
MYRNPYIWPLSRRRFFYNAHIILLFFCAAKHTQRFVYLSNLLILRVINYVKK